ncbi:MAG TPA: peptidoglycan-binding protein, partial [Pseudomonadales bacterium]|nr:peptidoglycan-binding protein [Pseudomonadales bacterium]
MLMREGSRGQEVTELQQALGIDADGAFGPGTRAAVEAYQRDNDLVVDGIVGPQTLAAIREANATTDNSEKVYSPYEDLVVNKYMLPKGEYKEGPTKKEYLFLHHTAGWNNPYKTVDGWAKDDRGAVATEFVLGGCAVPTGRRKKSRTTPSGSIPKQSGFSIGPSSRATSRYRRTRTTWTTM